MWIITKWLYISPEVTVKGFKKSCISSAIDETDNLWNGSAEVGNTEWPKKMYTLFTHQYLWNKFK